MKVSGGFVCGAWLGLSACQLALDVDGYTFASDVAPYSGSGGQLNGGGANTGGANAGGANAGGANTGGANTGGANAGGISGVGTGSGGQGGTGGPAENSPQGSAGAAGAGAQAASLQISDGYAAVGPFHGYSYTFIVVSTDAAARPVTVSPVCDENGCVPAFDRDAICARGVVGSAPDFASSAYAGLDLNQDRETGSSGSLTLEGQALVVTFSNAGASELRVQLVTPDGTAYCHELDPPASSAVLPFGEFNTACWDGTGSPFATSTPVLALHLLVPSVSDADVPFEFCLLDVSTR